VIQDSFVGQFQIQEFKLNSEFPALADDFAFCTCASPTPLGR